MRGYCKCDLCGSVYNETENATIRWKNKAGENRVPVSDARLCKPSGELIDDMPAFINVCPKCFERYAGSYPVCISFHFSKN